MYIKTHPGVAILKYFRSVGETRPIIPTGDTSRSCESVHQSGKPEVGGARSLTRARLFEVVVRTRRSQRRRPFNAEFQARIRFDVAAGRVSSVHDQATAPSQWFRDYGRSFLRGYLYNQRRGNFLQRLASRLSRRSPLSTLSPPARPSPSTAPFLFPSFSYYFLVFSWQTSPFARLFFLLARAKDPSERLID